MPAPIIVTDSNPRVGPEAAGAVVVDASQGGTYAVYLTAIFEMRPFQVS